MDKTIPDSWCQPPDGVKPFLMITYVRNSVSNANWQLDRPAFIILSTEPPAVKQQVIHRPIAIGARTRPAI